MEEFNILDFFVRALDEGDLPFLRERFERDFVDFSLPGLEPFFIGLGFGEDWPMNSISDEHLLVMGVSLGSIS